MTLVDAVDPSPYYQEYERHRPRAAAERSFVRSGLAAVAERTVMCRWYGLGTGPRPEWLAWVVGSGFDRSVRVLDVGAGSGALLGEMHRWGFTNLTGIDPWLPSRVLVADGVAVEVCGLDDVSETYDLIVFHDSLEHVDDPLAQLLAARECLSPRGRIAIALPVADGPVWEEYRDNWIGLDAPVHRFVPSLDGLVRLTRRAGLSRVRWHRSCADYHLRGSERIARRMSADADDGTAFSPGELRFLRRKSARLRRSGVGPQVSAVFEAAVRS